MAARPRRRRPTSPASSTAARRLPSRSSRRTRAMISPMSRPRPRRRALAGSSTARSSSSLNGESADTLIVTARTKGGQRDAAGIGVFLVPANAKGVTKKGYPTQDGLHAADITLHRRRGRRGCRDRRSRKRIAADRARGRRGPHRDLRRGGRHDGRVAEDHGGISEDAQAVRRADRQLPDPAAPRRRHVRGAGAGPQHVDVRDHGERLRQCQGARHRGRGGQGADRQVAEDSSASSRSSSTAASA